MADDDDKILRRYRELPREEPPRHLDDAILAAARRAVHTRPAPLVVPSGRQRWYFPLAAAAIIVLAVAVTMHMEREQPAEELMSTASAPAAAAPAVAPPPREMARNEQSEKPKAERKRKVESTDSRELRDQATAAPPPELQKAPEPAPPPVAPAQDAVGSVASSGRILERTEAPKAAQAPTVSAAPAPAKAERRVAAEGARAASSLSAFAMQSPEQWLQGIADLRRQGRHEEADKELAEFRKRHPDYEIPPAMRERIERR
jgi:hypothetical protein